MDNHPWIAQEAEKYRDHDLTLEEIPEKDLANIKGIVIRSFVDTKETDVTKLTISAFMGYLSNNGFRITENKK